MLKEKIEEMWARTQKWIEEGSFEEHLPEFLEPLETCLSD